jgi:hypothetical protein
MFVFVLNLAQVKYCNSVFRIKIKFLTNVVDFLARDYPIVRYHSNLAERSL